MTKPSTPALARWERELKAGTRTVETFDDLWRAACWDMAAVAAHEAGHERRQQDCTERRGKLMDGIVKRAQQARSKP